MDHFIGKVQRKEYISTIDIWRRLAALERAGAILLLLLQNAAPLFLRFAKEMSLPMISIVEATAREAQRLCRADFWTGFHGFRFFPKSLVATSRSCPTFDSTRVLNKKLFKKWIGIFKEETRKGLEEVIRVCKKKKILMGLSWDVQSFPLIFERGRIQRVLS